MLKDKKYCTCEICPQLYGKTDTDPDSGLWITNWCHYYEAQVTSPSKTWCSVGIAAMWMMAHKPKEVVEFLTALKA